MRIKLVLISEEKFTTIREKAALLSQAMMQGETGKSDLITEEIFRLAGNESSVSIEEADWVLFHREMRKTYRDYKAEFIPETEDLMKLSEVDMDNSFPDLLALVKMALKQKKRIIQIPYEEEDSYV